MLVLFYVKRIDFQLCSNKGLLSIYGYELQYTTERCFLLE